MKAIIFKTKPYSIFRLGSGSLEETDKIIHSDTLFSAIVNVHVKVFDNTENFIRLFENGKIKISSAFPMLYERESGKKIYFLPKPEFEITTGENIKAEKKVKFVSLETFKTTMKNYREGFIKNNVNLLLGSDFVVSKNEIIEAKESETFIKILVKPKTKVHTIDQENAFYHETDIQLIPLMFDNKIFEPNFYFLYELECNDAEKKEFFTCLNILADEGIGGERSSGKGHFEKIILDDIQLNIENSPKRLLLSLFNPRNQEEFDAVENYEILVRGGGSISYDTENDEDEEIIKPYRKKQVRLIAEGAIINANVEGRLVDITPEKGAEYKIFRNGKSFTIPLG